ncbi:MAG: ribonuclease E/G [Alphaproteobacteria bacterium]
MLISCLPQDGRAALLVDDRIEAFEMIREPEAMAPGAIHIGRVERVSRHPAAAWLRLDGGGVAFLRLGKSPPRALAEGSLLPVQIESAAWADKEARVSQTLTVTSRALSLCRGRPGQNHQVRLSSDVGHGQERDRLLSLLRAAVSDGRALLVRAPGSGLPADRLLADLTRLDHALTEIERLCGEATAPTLIRPAPEPLHLFLRDMTPSPVTDIVVDSAAQLAAARRFTEAEAPEIGQQLRLHDGAGPLFETEGVSEQLAELVGNHVALPGGGSLIIESGAAMTTIDVNSGAGDPMAANRAAAAEIARQLQLRSLAGAIIIDFIAPPRSARHDLLEMLRARTKADPAGVHVLGWTPLGHVELTRRRIGPGLAERLLSPDSVRTMRPGIVAGDILRALLAIRRRRPADSLVVTTSALVAECLKDRLGLVQPVEVRVETLSDARSGGGFDVR